jgi:PmbA protein
MMPDAIISEIAEFYRMYSSNAKPEVGKMKVLFMPSSMVFLIWRILYGTSSRAVYEKRSPLADKIEERILSEKITIYDDPLEDSHPEARAFDDEGVQCKPLSIVANGKLKSFYYDLNYAHKMGVVSTGHGYKYDYFGKDSLTRKPTPYLGHLRIKHGNKTFSQLLRTIKRGIIVEGILGPHAGNLFNGDYSIGVNPGLYVENGRIVGRIKDAMIAGNTYETLSNVIDIGDSLCPCYWYYCVGRVPAILCDNVSVTTKK